MRKLIIWIVCCIGMYPVAGQVQVNLQLPPIGLTVKSQLWNMAVVNTSGMELSAKLVLTMTDLTTGEVVLNAETRTFQLPKGIKQVRMTDLLPVNYTVVSTSYLIDANPEGFLPVGLFRCCFLLRIQEGKYSDVEECQDAQVEPLSPPILISPSDSERIESGRPTFIWSPPMPYKLFSNLQYDLFVAEVIGSQSAGDAIQQNIPLLYQQNIASPNFQYPLSTPRLDTGRLYAWQIIAKNNMLPVGKSEAWLFKLKNPESDTIRQKLTGIYHARLTRDVVGAPVICSGVLHYAYNNEQNLTGVKVNVYDITGSIIRQVKLQSTVQPLKYGENLVSLDLKENREFINEHFYLLELETPGGEHWYLKFEYRK